MVDLAVWMAAAYRSGGRPSGDDAPPDPRHFAQDVLERESEDLDALAVMGVSVLTIRDDEYPERLRGDGAPLVLQVAGRTSLLNEEGVQVFRRYRGEEGERLMEALDSGTRVMLVLSKGLLKAKSLLRALHEPLADGCIALLSAEPPRASWGPLRDRRRDAICAALRSDEPPIAPGN